MQILNRSKEDISKYSCGCVAVRVYPSEGIRVCDDVPATVVIACKEFVCAAGIADWCPIINVFQVDVGGLLKIIAIAVSDASAMRIIARRVAGVQKFRQSDQVFA